LTSGFFEIVLPQESWTGLIPLAKKITMSHQDCVVGIFPTVESAQSAVEELKRAGLGGERVSLVTRGKESELDVTTPLDQGDEAEKGAAVGAAAGATLGLLAGSALLIIPGIGPVVFAGAMASGITGGIVGGIVGAMSGWGVRENHAQEFEHELRNGKTIVLVTGDPLELAEAQSALDDSAAERVVLLAESADSSVDR
jgi:outer membrane lipoprotein SlyB